MAPNRDFCTSPIWQAGLRDTRGQVDCLSRYVEMAFMRVMLNTNKNVLMRVNAILLNGVRDCWVVQLTLIRCRNVLQLNRGQLCHEIVVGILRVQGERVEAQLFRQRRNNFW